jgi:hypothetical protein
MKVVLKNVRLSYPALFEPRAFQPGDTAKYKATFLIPKGDPQIAEIEAAILAAATEGAAMNKFAKDVKKTLAAIRNNPNKFCFQDGDLKGKPEYADMMVLSASNVTRPIVVDRGHTKDNPRILSVSDGRPYAGCYVNASLDLFAYNKTGNGIAASLGGVQFWANGEAFAGGGAAPLDAFDDLSVEDEEEALV